MNFNKMIKWSVLALIVATSPVMAQSDTTAPTARSLLPESIVRRIEKSKGRAAEQYANEMYSIDPSGNINAASISKYFGFLVAERRARALEQLAIYDQDFDGSLTLSELGDALERTSLSGRERVRFSILITRGDVDQDGALSNAEMLDVIRRTHTVREVKTSRNRGVEQLMAFDLDNNGTATLAEMIQIVEEQQLKCNC